jgi:hypothetical protein
MSYFIFPKYLDSLDDFTKTLMSKFLLNLLVQISKALVYSKIQFLFENESSSDFSPSLPTLARFAPQAAESPLSPFGPNSLGVFAERCISFDFAHSDKDAFSLSRHCHVGPACQLHPLPHAGRSHSWCHFSSSPPATLCCPTSNIEIPSKV